MIISCTAVTSVRIDDLRHTSESGSPARDSQAPTLPLCALTALAFLPALRVLEVTYDCALPPGTLPTPASLHELNLYGSSLGPAMSQYLRAVGVKRLRLRFVEAADLSSLPWASLECLRIDLSRLMSSEQVGRVTERLQQQVYFLSAAPQPSSGSTLFHLRQLASAPLNRLTEAAIFHHNDQTAASFKPYEFSTTVPLKRLLLDLVPATSLSYTEPVFPAVGWTTLRYLKICTNADMREQVRRLTVLPQSSHSADPPALPDVSPFALHVHSLFAEYSHA